MLEVLADMLDEWGKVLAGRMAAFETVLVHSKEDQRCQMRPALAGY